MPSRKLLSESPFGPTLEQLMSEREMSYRMLADATRRIDGKGITSASINLAARGHDKPSLRLIELVAQALQVPPETFAEYRLEHARMSLDPREVGFDQALASLKSHWRGRINGTN